MEAYGCPAQHHFYYSQCPDVDGHFCVYGGRFVFETLMANL